MTYVLGVTGSIGTGKTTLCTLLKRVGVPVLDSDRVVRDIYAHDPHFLEAFQKSYPDYVVGGAIDQQAVSRKVFYDDLFLGWLESLIHPMVLTEAKRFILKHQGQGTPMVALDMPLLFEGGFETLCHGIVLTWCPPEIQRERVLERPNMTHEKYESILSRQWPYEQKKALATWCITTDQSLLGLFKDLRALAKRCSS